MTLQSTIHQLYGVRIQQPPRDGVFRQFKIDQFRRGFICSIDVVTLFGCKLDGEIYAFTGDHLECFELATKSSEKIRMERAVVECAMGLVGRGERLSREDADRLELALERLDQWL
ncbi:MAG: hypothetical protein [Caudoviricetes sp.]|nr:MAG: hypothetical protein [Caudoviricetes sp.]